MGEKEGCGVKYGDKKEKGRRSEECRERTSKKRQMIRNRGRQEER